ncbi:MAG: hypothetical protein P1U67_08705 [Alcanivoracaceae bacterium]|nr:hypothetical protein [Alcanivoracaceae bacterium]
MAKIKSNNKTYCRFVRSEKINSADLERMYEIFREYYGNTDMETFIRDFSKKTGAFLVRSRADRHIVGFSTVALMDLTMNGRKAKGVFSGDTIIEKEYWGGRALQTHFFFFMLRTILRYPFTPLFWLLISKGYKTYLLMANNFMRFYPHPDGKNEEYEGMVAEYSERLFPGCYDAERGVLDFGEQYQHLHDDVAGITQEMCDRYRNIAFFEQRNPTWRRGTELPCIGRVSIYEVPLYILRFFGKVLSGGKLFRNNKPLKPVNKPLAARTGTARGTQ